MDSIEIVIESVEVQPVKRRPGRPKKVLTEEEIAKKEAKYKKKIDEIPAIENTVSVVISEEEHEKLLSIIDLVKEVGVTIGKGFTEGVYHQSMCIELQKRGILYTSEEPMPIVYKDVVIGYHTKRLDIILRSFLPFIIELKAVSGITTTSLWQLVRYLKNKKCKMGAVVNYSQTARGGIGIKVIVENSGVYYIYDPTTRLGIEVPSSDYKMDFSAKIEDDDGAGGELSGLG
jgi:GxxExxY protein